MQIGLSPKLYPAVALAVLGIIVTLVIDREVGLGMLGTAALALGGGYAQPTGEIVPGPIGAGSDARLDAGAAARLNDEAGQVRDPLYLLVVAFVAVLLLVVVLRII